MHGAREKAGGNSEISEANSRASNYAENIMSRTASLDVRNTDSL